MQRCTWLVIFSLLFHSAHPQNLVANGGFEERNVCIEYQVTCAPEAWFFMPRYAQMSPTESRDGNHYEIIRMGEPRKETSVGNYIYTKMLCTLMPQAKYRLSFRIHIPTFDFDYLDLWIAPGEPGSRNHSLYSRKRLITITPDSVTGNSKDWMQVNFTFTANGGERYLTIGNFQQKALLRAKRSSRKKRPVNYWIDEVRLVALDPALQTCPEYEAIKDQVYNNNFRHPARFVEAIPIDSSLFPGRPKKDTVRIVPPIVPTVKPTPSPHPKTDTLIVPDVLFEFNSSRLNPAFAARIDSLGERIRNIVFAKLRIEGHTDNVGTDAYNLKLSGERAVTIKTYLADKHPIASSMMETAGFGETRPRATNATANGRQLNRRVEIIIFSD
ncbi:MAG: OmpA family protein [Chitinophagaceae bacterium]|nr:OmpA family protein [Chitinophagaceae bacterium]